MKTTHSIRAWLGGGALLIGLALLGSAFAQETKKPQNIGPENPNGGCIACHKFEVKSWQETKHYGAHDQLESDEAYEWVEESLEWEVDAPVESARCNRCHTSKLPKKVVGVSCESCHGSAEFWVKEHYDFGEGVKTPQEETAEHRTQRYAKCDELGMIRPGRIYLFVSNCQSCHTVDDEEIVNKTGHPATSAGFELVGWSHGEVRHNFLENKENPEKSMEIRRAYYVVGYIADLEFSLRALGKAKEADGKYAKAMTAKATAAKAALGKIHEALTDEGAKAQVKAVLDAAPEIKADVAMLEVADAVRAAGLKIAVEHKDGQKLGGVEGLLPEAGAYKGDVFEK